MATVTPIRPQTGGQAAVDPALDTLVQSDDMTPSKAWEIGGKAYTVESLSAMRILRLGKVLVGEFKWLANEGLLDMGLLSDGQTFVVKMADALEELFERAPDRAAEVMAIIVGARDTQTGYHILENVRPIPLMEMLNEFTEVNPVEDIIEYFLSLKEKWVEKYRPFLARLIPSSTSAPISPSPDMDLPQPEPSPGNSFGSTGSTSTSEEYASSESETAP